MKQIPDGSLHLFLGRRLTMRIKQTSRSVAMPVLFVALSIGLAISLQTEIAAQIIRQTILVFTSITFLRIADKRFHDREWNLGIATASTLSLCSIPRYREFCIRDFYDPYPHPSETLARLHVVEICNSIFAMCTGFFVGFIFYLMKQSSHPSKQAGGQFVFSLTSIALFLTYVAVFCSTIIYRSHWSVELARLSVILLICIVSRKIALIGVSDSKPLFGFAVGSIISFLSLSRSMDRCIWFLYRKFIDPPTSTLDFDMRVDCFCEIVSFYSSIVTGCIVALVVQLALFRRRFTAVSDDSLNK